MYDTPPDSKRISKSAQSVAIMTLLQQVINTLRIPAPLPTKNKDHNLSGNYSGYRECHIEPDWLLIYNQTDTELRLDRTGTHADLFGM